MALPAGDMLETKKGEEAKGGGVRHLKWVCGEGSIRPRGKRGVTLHHLAQHDTLSFPATEEISKMEDGIDLEMTS